MRTVLLRVILAVIASAAQDRPANTDGSDVQRVTTSPTFGHQPG